MIYGFLSTLFVVNALFLILIIMIQKGKSSMGMGALGGHSQMLFGGSGGQDLLQKTTWVMAFIFMSGSLILAIMRTQYYQTPTYRIPAQTTQQPTQTR